MSPWGLENGRITRQKMKKMHDRRTFGSVQDYETARAAIVAAESEQAFDAKAIASATFIEKEANRLVAAVRGADEQEVYGAMTDSKGRRRAPADHFLGAVQLINKTQLFRIAHRMPKGAHLHCHFNSCLNPEFLISHARRMESMYIRSTCPLDSEERMDAAEISFLVQPAELKSVDVFKPDYEPMTLMNYPLFCDRYPGGQEAAEDWLKWKMLLREEEVYDTYQTGTEMWKRFDICTRMMKGLFSYESAFRSYTQACMRDFIDDGIQYAEIRPNFPSNALIKDDGSEFIDNFGLMAIIEEELEKFKKQEPSFGMKVIYCTPRSFTNEQVERSLNECIELKGRFRSLLCGYDLVGAEDRGRPLRDFLKELLEFREKCDQHGLDIPFLFHAGETLDTGSSTDQNLIDAVLLKSKRIGHGFALPKHPEAMRLVKENNIALELCPISNEILGLCSTARGHTFPILLANNVHCTVNSDNGTFYSSTLSHDFYQVMIGSKAMSLLGWKVLCEWSIDHSCMTKSEMDKARKGWKDSWYAFCHWIIDEFSSKYPSASNLPS